MDHTAITISAHDEALINTIEAMADTDAVDVTDLLDRVPAFDRHRAMSAIIELERLCSIVIDGQAGAK